MVAHIVEFMIRNDVKYIVMTATLARDLVDAKVQITEDLDPSDPELERRIAEHQPFDYKFLYNLSMFYSAPFFKYSRLL